MKKRVLSVLLCIILMCMCLYISGTAAEREGELLPDPSFDSTGKNGEWTLDALGETVLQAGKTPTKAVMDLHAKYAPENVPYPLPRSDGENSIVFRDVNG